MTKQFWLGAMGISLVVIGVGCSEGVPNAPSTLASNDFSAASGSTAATTYSYPVVTFEPDRRAHPDTVYVRGWDKVLMINKTSQYVLVRSSDCSQFSSVGLQPGASTYTSPFYPGAKTCNYYVWDYPDKIHQGRVIVQ